VKAGKLSVIVCGVIVGACVIYASAIQSSASTSTTNVQPDPNWMRVDRAARNAANGDEAAVRTLVNEVFADNGIDEKIVATAGAVPDRLVAAEIAFQKGKTAGIGEGSVVNAINQLALRFNAPEYAFTDVKELRRLRLKMLTVYPGLIGRGSAATRDDTKHHFDAGMSPVEAFHVTATLVFQKLTNPEFQFSRKEIDSAPQQDESSLSKLSQAVANGERSRELRGIIRQNAAAMSLRDILSQSEQTLDRLGIPR